VADLVEAGAPVRGGNPLADPPPLPDAALYELDDGGVRRVRYENTDPFALTKAFLESPDRFFRHLFADDDR
jgi:hypothetical protein